MRTSPRLYKLVPLILATLLLAGGVWLAHDGLKQLAQARQQSLQIRQSLDNTRSLLPEVQQREQLLHAIQNFTAQVRQMGFDPAHWGERRLSRVQGAASRAEAAGFLAELGRGGDGQVFIADAFDIAVVTPDADLFLTPRPGDQGVSLNVAGTLHFQKLPTASLQWMTP